MTDIIHNLNDIDQEITLAVNSLNCPASDQIWQFFSDNTVWIPLYIAITIMLVYRLGWKKAMIVIASLAITFALCDFLSDMVKHSVNRLRPAYDTRMIHDGIRILEKKGSLFGFFSCHAANTFGFAICSFLGFRNDRSRNWTGYGILIFAWAFLVSMSRVFVGKHYMGDIMTGAFFGLATGYLIGLLARLAVTRLR
mgnify:CR=1 FL=1